VSLTTSTTAFDVLWKNVALATNVHTAELRFAAWAVTFAVRRGMNVLAQTRRLAD